MANRCESRLTISGPAETLAAFLDGLTYDEEQHPQLLLTYVPLPEVFKSDDPAQIKAFLEEAGLRSPRAWREAFWGTKWPEARTEVVERTPERVEFTFSTPWTPPLAALDTIAQAWPAFKLKLMFIEFNAGYWGEAVWHNGQPDYLDWVDWDSSKEIEQYDMQQASALSKGGESERDNDAA